MNSRERLIASINHIEPEKVPVDLGSNPSSAISAIAYDNLKKHLGFSHPTLIYDVVQQLAQPHNDVIEKLGIDVVDLGRMFNSQQKDWYPINMPNGQKAFYPNWFKPVQEPDGSWIGKDKNGIPIAKMPNKATFFDQTIYPWVDGYPDKMEGLDNAMSQVLWSAFVHSPWDNMDKPDFWEQLRSRTLELRKNTDKAIVVVAGCNLFEWGTFIRRMDNFMMDLYLDPVNAEALLDAFMERHMVFLAKVCDAVGDIADVIRFGDDLGAMNGPFMDTETYKQFFKPRHKMLCDYVKANSNMKTFLHSCGSIYSLIPDLIDAGFDILNPVQTQCRDMQPEKLKNEFGKEITFWGGGIETVGTLNIGSEEDVRKQTLERLEILSKGGGFVFNPIHNVMPEVPPENIIAMFNAVKEFNGEPKIIIN
jgi:uroporphyrinogen decarboxylase